MIPLSGILWPGTGWLATIASIAFILAMLWAAHRQRQSVAPKPQKKALAPSAAAPAHEDVSKSADKKAEQDYIWR